MLFGAQKLGHLHLPSRRQQGVTASDYHPAVMLGKLLPRTPDPWRFVDVAGPIRDTDGSLSGVLAIHLSWAWARNLARDLLTPAQRDMGAEIIVVRNDGVVLLGPEDMLEKRIATESLALSRARPAPSRNAGRTAGSM